MTDPTPPSSKALRKLKRRAENDAYAKEARFWEKPKTALRLGYDRPVNRQAAKDLSAKRRRKPHLPN
jgi:hypothetical protein